ncbi:hypothetical protein BGZ60DRAFT_527498 [Tricladium varicosporioides]|nr:hypothetical protein BGZ60DRAFT_527498 [Hymenoscyphus varicosporioides]
MRTSFFLLPASIALVNAIAAPQATPVSSSRVSVVASSTSSGSQSTSSAAPGTVALGAQCDPSATSPCQYGAQCYATNSMLIPACGNFQAVCTSNAQCAFNTCSNGFCNGPPTPGVGALGQPCSPKLAGQCANGADCYATNFMLIPSCGNFQAACSTDSQCAFNNCNAGLCNGPLASSLYRTGSSIPTASSSGSSGTRSVISTAASLSTVPTAAGTGGATPTPYGNSTTTGAFSGARTTVVTIGGKPTSVLINSAGSTSAIPSAATPSGSPLATVIPSSGSKDTVQAFAGIFSFAMAIIFANLL